MRLISEPIPATLNAGAQLQSGPQGQTNCTATPGTAVEIIGQVNQPGKGRSDYLLVRAVDGPCQGARGTVPRDQLTVVQKTG